MRIPNPQLLTAEYDAWNRLVTIKDGAAKIREHVYDARGYRIRRDTYTSGTLTEAWHDYYTPGWQCVEERVGTSTTLERQFVFRVETTGCYTACKTSGFMFCDSSEE